MSTRVIYYVTTILRCWTVAHIYQITPLTQGRNSWGGGQGGHVPSSFFAGLPEKCSKFDQKSQILKIFACGGQF